MKAFQKVYTLYMDLIIQYLKSPLFLIYGYSFKISLQRLEYLNKLIETLDTINPAVRQL